MPFGLHNAAQKFQQCMDHLLRHWPFVFTYLYDHIASHSMEEYLKHLEISLKILCDNGLTINLTATITCYYDNTITLS
jgi:hypothetical protein